MRWRWFSPDRGEKVIARGVSPWNRYAQPRRAPGRGGTRKENLAPQSFLSMHCHIAFSTKERFPMIAPEWADRLYEYIGGILRANDCQLLAAGGIPDHVHLLVSLGKTTSPAEIVRLAKANSSSWINETFSIGGRFSWQIGYGAFSVSYSQLDRVRHYLASQATHHRTQPFGDEFLALLRRHDIAYDERYVLD